MTDEKKEEGRTEPEAAGAATEPSAVDKVMTGHPDARETVDPDEQAEDAELK